MRTRGLIAVLYCVQFASSVIASEDVPVLTVCEVLSDLERYEGRSIIVVGRSVATSEGTWLDEDCGMKLVRAEREFGAVISTAYPASEYAPPPEVPKGFRWDKRLLQQKLEQLKRTTQLRVYKNRKYNDQWLAVFGRLETRLPREGRFGDYTYGFGHLSGAPAQLVSSGAMRVK